VGRKPLKKKVPADRQSNNFSKRNTTMAKTALITGATAGIGNELSRVFAQNGFNRVLVARNKDKLAQMAKELEKNCNITVSIIKKDLCEQTAAQTIYDEVSAAGHFIDVLVNNAGIGMHGLFTDFDNDTIMNVIGVNITSLTLLCRLFGADMVKNGSGKIMNVSSTAAFQAGPRMSVYYASKDYVLMLSEALNFEVKKSGVTVTALCPGPTRTEFFDRHGMSHLKVATGPWVMDADDVAKAGFAGMMKGKRIVIPGFLNWISAFLTRFSPRNIPAAIVNILNQ